MNTKFLNTINLDDGKVIIKKGSGGGDIPHFLWIGHTGHWEEYIDQGDGYGYTREAQIVVDAIINLDTLELDDRSYLLTVESGEYDNNYIRELYPCVDVYDNEIYVKGTGMNSDIIQCVICPPKDIAVGYIDRDSLEMTNHIADCSANEITRLMLDQEYNIGNSYLHIGKWKMIRMY